MKKEYICDCGKVFDNPQKFNGHKTHCKIHLGEERYQQRMFQQKDLSKIGNKVQAENWHIKKQQKLDQWLSEQHTCETCGKVMTEYYGSGRFCCVQCANTRKHSKETREKISISALQNCSEGYSPKPNSKFKTGYYKGIYCASSYELVYLIYCLDNNINIQRASSIRIPYEWENKKHVYIPDFYLPDMNSIVELKGLTQFFDEDVIKIKLQSAEDYGYNIIYIDSTKIEPYFKYVRQKYDVKDVWSLYDGSEPEIAIKPKKYKNGHPKYRYMYNPKTNAKTFVIPDQVDQYLAEGWLFVKKQKNKPNY